MTTPSIASTVDLLRQARDAGVARLDALLLLAHHWQRSRTWLLAHDGDPLPQAIVPALVEDLHARADGVPLAYLTGHQDFHGLSLLVDRRVLIPRPETEHLVDWALEVLATRAPDAAEPTVVDLGTGSGAIALAVKLAHPSARVHAVDISEDALNVAMHNARRLGLDIHGHVGDWWQGGWTAELSCGIDLVLANPPYVADGDAHLDALRHEPRSALVALENGLGDLQAIVASANRHLVPGGRLLLEHGHDQAPAVQSLLQQQGFADVSGRLDLAGHVRCSGGVCVHGRGGRTPTVTLADRG